VRPITRHPPGDANGYTPAWLAANCHAARGDVLARRRQARRRQFRRQANQVGKAGREAYEVDHVFRARVQFHHTATRKIVMPGHIFEVGAGCAAVVHRNLHQPRGRNLLHRRVFHALPHQVLDFRVSQQARIEFHQHGRERRMQVPDAARASQRSDEPPHRAVRLRRDFFAKSDQQRPVAGSAYLHVTVIVAFHRPLARVFLSATPRDIHLASCPRSPAGRLVQLSIDVLGKCMASATRAVWCDLHSAAWRAAGLQQNPSRLSL
jgi:hypothetical protein